MGNQQSGDGSGTNRSTGRFMRTTGLLGLSKSELDERCKPSGLYPSCNWEDKAIKKLIGDGKLAARLRGTENRQSPTDRECPICFLQYKEVNTTKCCSAYICTECYLQVRPQKVKSHSCPFCNHHKFSVTVAKEMNAEAMLAREETEQRFIEAKIREHKERKDMEDAQKVAAAAEASEQQQQAAAFGQSLQNQLRARSSSISDHDDAMNIPESVLRESFMSPEERRMLEDEMKAQHSHPLSLRLEAEAQERRLHNEQEFLRQNPTHALEAQMQAARAAARSSRRGRGSERRNWNQIVEAFEQGGHGGVNSLDDLVVLEAAMILSMEEESRRRTDGGGGAGGDGFDANRHASDGFPLVRNLLAGGANSTTDEQLQILRNSLRGRSRNSLMRAHGGGAGGAAAMATAGFGMGGMTEDDQVAMAIAASLQDQQQQEQQQSEGEQQPSEGETQPQLLQAEGEPASSENITNTAAAASTSEEGQQAAEMSSAAAAAPAAEAGDIAINNDDEDDEAEFHVAAEETFETAREEDVDVEFETPTAEAPSESAAVDVDEIETAAAQPTSEEPAAAATAESTAEGGGGSVPDSLDVTNHGEEA